MTEEQRLLYRIMKSYDRSSRPVFSAQTPVVIRLGITLTQVLDVDEKNQILTTNVWLDQEWVDEKLQWTNISEFAHIKIFRIPCDLIWLPDIVLYNSVDNHNKGYMKSLAMVEQNGNVFWPPIVRMRSSCKMDITYFPFDDQVCKLKMGSWAYDGFQVDVTNRTMEVDTSNYVDNGEWTLIDTKVVRNVKYYPCCPEPFPDVTFYIHLRRRVLYYAFNVIIPCMLLSSLTLTGFLLPPDSGEKVTLGLTVLLAFSVFMLLIAENMPPTSEYIPLIGIYLTVIMAMSGLSVVFSVFVLNIHHKGALSKGPPRILKGIVLILAKMLCLKVQFQDESSYTPHTGSYTSNSAYAAFKARDSESLLLNSKHEKIHGDLGDVSDDTLNDVMNQNINMSSPTANRTNFDREVVTYFKHVMSSYEQTVTERRTIHDWQEVARVMDKFFFWLFLSITFISSFIILVISPMTKEIDLNKT
ncbi:acetylcholine receptor subunit alpha-type acr-16-like [Ylistrum balloti]|uniref:acetylcholine receptor subunit alpha-type acr-16-like n=1 Tax=Ylistrum balloti TaxID=509963 RepID=UPI002905E9EA|nr:acetylcholine receptor subunit alpha-type acr-16-like [Ylistrum balloti]